MASHTDYTWVLGHYVAQGRRSKWFPIEIHKLSNVRDAASNTNVFATIQRWRTKDEASMSGVHYAPLYFDIDCEDLSRAQEDTKKVVSFFFNAFQLNKESIQVYFSGKKGFHIIINPAACGITPHENLAAIFRNIAKDIVKITGADTIDIGQYAIKRQFRLVDSKHGDTGLYKIELYIEELFDKELDIKSLATSKRGALWDSKDIEGVSLNEDFFNWYQEYVNQYTADIELSKSHRSSVIPKDQGFPLCIQDLLNNYFPGKGDRNKSTLNIACYFKGAGRSESECERVLLDWASGIPTHLSSSPPKVITQNTLAVIKSVYSDEKYNFACKFVRGLSTDDRKIKCNRDKCQFVKIETDAEIIKLHLADSSHARHTGKTISTDVLVIGKGETPYIVPKVIQCICYHAPDCNQKFCNIKMSEGAFNYTVDESSLALIEYISETEKGRNTLIKQWLGIPYRCPRPLSAKIELKENINIEELVVVPEAQRGDILQVESQDQHYVMRTCFSFSHGVIPNAHYEIVGKVFPEPKTKRATIVVTNAVPKEHPIDAFEMTPDLHESLQVFQPSSWSPSDIQAKLDDIYLSLESNIHKIYGRSRLNMAVDLVYHSVLSIEFQGILITRGWVECMIIGDTGTGKTTLVERLMNHYQLGKVVSGENLKRTGLIYTMVQTLHGKWIIIWGEIPLGDRGLRVIDEFNSAGDNKLLEQLSRSRSTGILQATGAAKGETNARTRLVIMTNPVRGKSLSSYNFGIESSLGLISSYEDIRRFDFMMSCSSSDVPVEVLNAPSSGRTVIKNKYTSDICKSLILWAWSRRPRQVIFEKGTEQTILDAATSLSGKYHSSIPLVEPSDMRIKLARLGAALACRLYSTEDSSRVSVLPVHIEVIDNFLRTIYDDRGLAYDLYSETSFKQSPTLSDSKSDEIVLDLRNFPEYRKLLEVLRGQRAFKKGELGDQVGYNREQMGELIKLLTRHRLIISTSRGYIKTPLFISFINKEMEKAKGEPAIPF